MDETTNADRAAPGRPRCFNCGHDLTGAVKSASCPECGRPLVEVLVRDESTIMKLMGKRYTSKATLFGLPALSIAMGLGPDGKQGHAKGWIAIGDRATGVIAFGGMARGVVAFGGFCMGGLTFGGLSIGLFGALGGAAIAPLGLALGGMAIGLLAIGGMTIGAVAVGGACVGLYAWGPPAACFAMHIQQISSAQPADPEAAAMFDRLSWLLGSTLNQAQLRPFLWLLSTYGLALLILGFPAVLRWQRGEGDPTASPPTSRPIR
ncbi:MAG: hypothetical protein JNM94_18640 [Phycisphaerae bacterium]|nr:hypothetical protein [Phycisphaerae bacterium]